ncbi:hypothetical protein BUALT_Bualt16G0065000 [Buddleja alternifolia]|uniref:Uncharacterized protein n=1 Tax=Buddleja alternifolia TaxID=168488 RepID=A0AAV6WEZ7_9LAMI|nr:hypothetical protein BUALT_Bualt16G0065000 [Buddleja alternifolia]
MKQNIQKANDKAKDVEMEWRFVSKSTIFRFDNFLVKDSQFLNVVDKVWRHNIVGVPLYEITRKLKTLKYEFKELWKKKGNYSLNVDKARKFLDITQSMLMEYPTMEVLQDLEKYCKVVFSRAIKIEREYLTHRAKLVWLKDCDQCISFFFKKLAVKTKHKIF